MLMIGPLGGWRYLFFSGVTVPTTYINVGGRGRGYWWWHGWGE